MNRRFQGGESMIRRDGESAIVSFDRDVSDRNYVGWGSGRRQPGRLPRTVRLGGEETMSDDNTIGLSRRRLLGGLGAIGVASAGAGIGTTAYFSDQEEFTGNTITAGEFGLSVEQSIRNVDQDDLGPDQEAWEEGSGDDSVWVTSPIDIADAKPGDEYKFCWEITVHDNPGYVAVAGSSTDENGVDAGNVELDDLWDIDDEDDLSTLGDEATAELVTKDSDGNELARVDYGTLGDLLESLESGILVSDDEGPYQLDAGETVTVCLIVTIPPEVGNEIQGAVTSTDMTFYAEQARHNDPQNVKDEAADVAS